MLFIIQDSPIYSPSNRSIPTYNALLERRKDITTVDAANRLVEEGGTTLGQFYGMRLAIEELRMRTYRAIRDDYRKKLRLFDEAKQEAFLSDIRKRPSVVGEIEMATRKLKALERSASWTTNAVAVIAGIPNGPVEELVGGNSTLPK